MLIVHRAVFRRADAKCNVTARGADHIYIYPWRWLSTYLKLIALAYAFKSAKRIEQLVCPVFFSSSKHFWAVAFLLGCPVFRMVLFIFGIDMLETTRVIIIGSWIYAVVSVAINNRNSQAACNRFFENIGILCVCSSGWGFVCCFYRSKIVIFYSTVIITTVTQMNACLSPEN